MCVGSNATPVRNRFERDEAEPSADKFCHTGTSIQDDSPKQKKTKDSQRLPWLIAERFKSAQKRRYPAKTYNTRVCAWVRIPLLSENVLNTMRHSLQPTNSVTLERQFKMTAQSKRKQKTRYVIRGRQPSGLLVHKKEDNQPRHVKHESTRGFERKSFHMDDTNRLAD